MSDTMKDGAMAKDEENQEHFDDALNTVRVLLPYWAEADPHQMRDLANGLRFLAERFEQANAAPPSLAEYKLERLRDLHRRGEG